MRSGQRLAFRSSQSLLALLVDDLVEGLAQEDGQMLSLVVGGGHIAAVFVGYLGDVIRNISPTWMISWDYQDCGESYRGMHHHAIKGKTAIALSQYMK